MGLTFRAREILSRVSISMFGAHSETKTTWALGTICRGKPTNLGTSNLMVSLLQRSMFEHEGSLFDDLWERVIREVSDTVYQMRVWPSGLEDTLSCGLFFHCDMKRWEHATMLHCSTSATPARSSTNPTDPLQLGVDYRSSCNATRPCAVHEDVRDTPSPHSEASVATTRGLIFDAQM